MFHCGPPPLLSSAGILARPPLEEWPPGQGRHVKRAGVSPRVCRRRREPRRSEREEGPSVRPSGTAGAGNAAGLGTNCSVMQIDSEKNQTETHKPPDLLRVKPNTN